ncbi:MAG: 30S ribosomal protein S17 [Candidatus Paceibacteria bacterium]
MNEKQVKKEDASKKKKVLSGVVVSDKMKDTAVVAVERFVKHPKYGKFIKRVKRYKAHDKDNVHKMGEKVSIESTKPISKDKAFKII